MAERIVWTSADGGSVIDLTDEASGFSVLANGTRGLRSPAYAFASEDYAGVDGSTVQSVRAVANTPTLGLLVQARGQDEFTGRVRQLLRAMRPKAGPGTLTATLTDGTTRTLTCFVTEGMEGDEAVDTILDGAWWKLALKFYAPDPWWYGDPRDIGYVLGPPPPWFPIFPLRFSRSDINGSTAVENVGDEDAYPVWTVTGPGYGLTLTNQTTGRSIALSTVLAAGQTVTIDTRPFFQSVISGDGTNLFGDLLTDPAMWVLAPGTNLITVSLTGATTASRIGATYRPRYPGIT